MIRHAVVALAVAVVGTMIAGAQTTEHYRNPPRCCTVGEAAQLRLTADQTTLRADGQELAFVTVEAADRDGQPHPHADDEVSFALSGPGMIAAVGNGDSTSEEPYQGSQRRLFNGKALVVVRVARTPGVIRLTASAPGLTPATIRIQSQTGKGIPAV